MRPAPDSRGRLRWLAVAAAVVAAGVAVRMHRHTELILLHDESYSWQVARYPVSELLDRVADDANPPLYYLALKGWVAVCGDSLTAMRGLSAVFAALTLAALVGFVRDLGGRRGWAAGVLVAALVAANPLQIAAGRMVRAYSMGTFLAVLSSWLLWRGLTDGRRRWWAGYAVAAAALAYTHHYGFFTLAAQGVFAVGWVCLCSPRADRPTLLRRGILSAVGASVLYLPWVPSMLRQMRGVKEDFWITQLRPETVADLAGYFLTGWQNLGPAATPAVLVLGGGLVLLLARRRDAVGGFLVLSVLLPWAAAVGVSAAGGRAILVDRYLAFAQLFYLTGLGLLIAGTTNRMVRIAAAGIVLLNFGYEAADLLRPPAAPGSNLEQLVAHLRDTRKADEAVVVFTPATATQVMYYASRAGVDLDLRVVGRFVKGAAHQPHASAIPDRAWVPSADLPVLPNPVAWVVVGSNSGYSLPPSWSVRSSRAFAADGLLGWNLIECERVDGRAADSVVQR